MTTYSTNILKSAKGKKPSISGTYPNSIKCPSTKRRKLISKNQKSKFARNALPPRMSLEIENLLCDIAYKMLFLRTAWASIYFQSYLNLGLPVQACIRARQSALDISVNIQKLLMSGVTGKHTRKRYNTPWTVTFLATRSR